MTRRYYSAAGEAISFVWGFATGALLGAAVAIWILDETGWLRR